MGERHTNLQHTGRAFTTLAAALFVMAGTAEALGQNSGGANRPPPPKLVAQQQPAGTNLAPPLPSGPASKPSGPGGKVIRKAGDQPAAPAVSTPAVPARPDAPAAAQPGEGEPPAADGDGKVKVDEHLQVDLHVNDEDLANVLQMLSIQAQRNIITSKNVSAVVTANLYGVTFYEALDAILHVNGYGYIEKGNFIYVYTLDEIKVLQEAERAPVWKVLKLNYLAAVDAGEFVKPLLSERGQIKTNGKPAMAAGGTEAPSGGEDFAHDSTLVVFDFAENLSEIEKILKEMDTRPAQVLIEATILQTSLNEANAFGVDFSIIGDLNFTDFVGLGGPLRAADALINGGGAGGSSTGTGTGTGTGTSTGTGGSPTAVIPGDDKGRALSTNVGNVAGPGTLKLGLVANDVAAFLRILDQVSDTTILSRPNVLCLNRQPARVLVGRKVGYLSTTATDTSTTQTVEFLDTGTQLMVRPFVSSDGMIRMDLRPKVSEAVIRNVTNTGGAAVTIPDEISNELAANVMVRDGQTIVLGGLFRESTTNSRRQIPGLGDIPIVGYAFRGHDDATDRNEIIFMITPTVVSESVLVDQGLRAEATVDRVRTGSREGLAYWSREKRTQQLMVQATELARQGNHDKALFKIRQSLRMNHNQPDAIALREAILNEKANWPQKSIQDEIISGELQKTLNEISAKHSSAESLPPIEAAEAADLTPAPAAPVVRTARPFDVPGEQDPGEMIAMRTAKNRAAPAPIVAVETLEPVEAPAQPGQAQPEQMWLPAVPDDAEESPVTEPATEPAGDPTAAAFPTPGLEQMLSATPTGTPEQPADQKAPVAEPVPAPVPVQATASTGTPGSASFGFRGMWMLYRSHAQRQAAPGASTITSAPTEGR
ncbi:MAG: hypothetical protein WD749_04060 [Phycisphaerales bacterium]